MSPDFDIQVSGCFQSDVHDFPPLVGEQLHFTVRLLSRRKSYIADESAVDACRFHGMKIPDNSLPRDIVVDPIPVNAGLYVGRQL